MSATRAAAAVLCGGLLLAATACGGGGGSGDGGGDGGSSGSTAPLAGDQLSSDARALLTDMEKLLAAPSPFTVSTDSADASKAVDCGKGKQKLTFSARMTVPATPNTHVALITDEGSANGWLVQHGYTLDTGVKADQSDSGRSAPMVNKKAGVHITVTLTPAGTDSLDYAVTGTTDCLRTA